MLNRRKLSTVSCWLAALLILLLAGIQTQADTAQGTNIALHKKVTTWPKSNYGLTKDRDPAQLTDGIYASTHAKWDAKHNTSSLWVQKGTLGWVHRKPVVITIDLGKDQPISGLIYSTGAGRAGVFWPLHIYISTSNDGQNWHYAGDLTKLSKAQPPKKGYANFRYITHNLHTHGRYIKLGVMSKTYVFSDEVEVLKGSPSLLKQSAGKTISPMKTFAKNMAITDKAKYRQNTDIDSTSTLLNNSSIDQSTQKKLKAKLAKFAQATEAMALKNADLKTIIPITKTERSILSVHGQALSARGFKPLTLWKIHRYAYRPLIELPKPDNGHAAKINVTLLNCAIRSDSVLLTNATAKPMTVSIRLAHKPKGAKTGWIKLASAIWTDTLYGQPVQNALFPLKKQGDQYIMTIPAGITGKLWVTIDSSNLPTGTVNTKLILTSGKQRLSVPVEVKTLSIPMGTPKLSLIVWDYSNVNYGSLTSENKAAAIKLMQSHFVNYPIATGWSALPAPKAQDFDKNNKLVKTPDFSNLDKWVALWPDAKYYGVFFDVRHRKTFAGKKQETDAFKARVNSWIKAVIKHWKTLDLKPSQLVLSLVDEPKSNYQDRQLLIWGSAIKEAAPKVKIFSDPIWRDPKKSKYYPKSLLIPDILCPHPDWEPKVYEKFRAKHNKTLFLYYADKGHATHSTGDPQMSYRQMAWRVFSQRGSGEGFWSFTDIRGAPSSFNGYASTRPMYSPVYFTKDKVYNSIHWDAVREGIEDFQVLTLLQNSIAKINDTSLKADAQRILNRAVKNVKKTDAGNPDFQWSKQTNPFVVDHQLQKVQMMLQNIEQ